jgi:hypothetical protein
MHKEINKGKVTSLLSSFGHWGRHHHQDAEDLIGILDALIVSKGSNVNKEDIFEAVLNHLRFNFKKGWIL